MGDGRKLLLTTPRVLETVPDELGACEYPADKHPLLLYLGSLSPGSRPTMISAARLVSRLLGEPDPLMLAWHRLRWAHVARLRRVLLDLGQKPAQVNKVLVMLRRVVDHAELLDLLDAKEVRRIQAVKPVPNDRLPVGRELPSAEIIALYGACDATPEGCRDAAFLALLFGGGLRRAEAIKISCDRLHLDLGTARVLGKRGKERETALLPEAIERLRAWLDLRGSDGVCLVRVTVDGTLSSEQLTTGGASRAFGAIVTRAGIPPATPHDARRTYVTRLLRAGLDPLEVAGVVGHGSVDTTRIYDRRTIEGVLAKVAKITLDPAQ